MTYYFCKGLGVDIKFWTFAEGAYQNWTSANNYYNYYDNWMSPSGTQISAMTC